MRPLRRGDNGGARSEIGKPLLQCPGQDLDEGSPRDSSDEQTSAELPKKGPGQRKSTSGRLTSRHTLRTAKNKSGSRRRSDTGKARQPGAVGCSPLLEDSLNIPLTSTLALKLKFGRSSGTRRASTRRPSKNASPINKSVVGHAEDSFNRPSSRFPFTQVLAQAPSRASETSCHTAGRGCVDAQCRASHQERGRRPGHPACRERSVPHPLYSD